MATITATVSPLRELISEASNALNVYRSPDIDDALERIDAILIAADLGSIQYDRVVRIDENKDHFKIHTEWSARGCPQNSEYTLPYSIVEAVDPIAAAASWARKQAIEKAQRSIDKAQLDLCYAQREYEKACAMPV